MNWPPRLSEHPAYNTLERKCRRLTGIIMNERERMADDGIDLSADWKFAWDTFEHTNALQERADKDPAARAELAAEQTRLDPILHAKFRELVGLVERYHPDSGALTGWRIYLMRWNLCVGEPLRPMPADYVSTAGKPDEEIERLWTTPVFGIPWAKLVAARQAIWDLKMEDKPANRDLAAWTLFLCGLVHGGSYAEATGAETEHLYDDGLPQAARESWNEAVDFAFDEATGRILDKHWEVFDAREAGQLFLGVTHTATHLTPDVASWLSQWDERETKLRLLVATGVISATDVYGHRLMRGLEDIEPLLAILRHRPGLMDIIPGFIYRQ